MDIGPVVLRAEVDTDLVGLPVEAGSVAAVRTDLVCRNRRGRSHSRGCAVELSEEVGVVVAVHVDQACLEQTSDRGTPQMGYSDQPFVDLGEVVVGMHRFYRLVGVEVDQLHS